MYNKEVTHQQVGKFYDSSVITKFWSQLKRKHMHVGYWDENTPFRNDLYEGAVRFTNLMISLTAVKEKELFVDIGCGYGIPAVCLAQTRKCKVYGVTASAHQKEYADQEAVSHKMENEVQFQVADANKLPFKKNMFDGGWFFESIFHIGHETALQEAGRVLKPGAELLIADFTKTGEFDKNEAEFLRREVGIKSVVYRDEYPDLLNKTGFSLLELRDITAHTLDMEKRWAVHLEIIENQKAELVAADSEENYRYLKSFFSQLHEIGKRAIGYCLVRAGKK